ncbi:MAG TPA: BrnA antitoxin family protein [Oligoflexia bacterium]|nr:BrnA antitoxin family protein [Oligoflexia bacterium]
MRKEYNFARSSKSPYAAKLKKQVTIRLDVAAIDYFKSLAAETGISYQNLVNLYLRDCAARGRKPSMEWTAGADEAEAPRTVKRRKSA